MTPGPKTDVNPLVKTPDSSIFCIANVKQLTYFNEYPLYFKTRAAGITWHYESVLFTQSENNPPSCTAVSYLFTYLLPDEYTISYIPRRVSG